MFISLSSDHPIRFLDGIHAGLVHVPYVFLLELVARQNGFEIVKKGTDVCLIKTAGRHGGSDRQRWVSLKKVYVLCGICIYMYFMSDAPVGISWQLPDYSIFDRFVCFLVPNYVFSRI